MRLVRTAFHVELLQSGLRREAVASVKASAAGHFDEALDLARQYLGNIRQEKRTALDARTICRSWLEAAPEEDGVLLARSETAAAAGTAVTEPEAGRRLGRATAGRGRRVLGVAAALRRPGGGVRAIRHPPPSAYIHVVW